MYVRRTLVAVISAAALLGTMGAVASQGAAKAKSYRNCDALHVDYPHGVGRSGARDRTRSGSDPVTNFKRSNALYAHNDGQAPRYPGERDLDRDTDRVACEQH